MSYIFIELWIHQHNEEPSLFISKYYFLYLAGWDYNRMGPPMQLIWIRRTANGNLNCTKYKGGVVIGQQRISSLGFH